MLHSLRNYQCQLQIRDEAERGDSASLNEDVKKLQEALKASENSDSKKEGKRQAAAQAMYCFLQGSTYRLKDSFMHHWSRHVWDVKAKKQRRTAQMRAVINTLALKQVYIPVSNLKENFKAAFQSKSANAEADKLREELNAIKALCRRHLIRF